MGQAVTAGQQTARVGRNGDSTGCHLRLEIKISQPPSGSYVMVIYRNGSIENGRSEELARDGSQFAVRTSDPGWGDKEKLRSLLDGHPVVSQSVDSYMCKRRPSCPLWKAVSRDQRQAMHPRPRIATQNLIAPPANKPLRVVQNHCGRP